MNRRYWIAAGIGAACTFAVLGLAAVLPESGVTKARYDSLGMGLTMMAVEATLGPPHEVVEFRRFAIGRWVNEDGSGAEIYFEKVSGNVFERRWHNSTETLGEKMRRWVRWPW